MGNLAAKAMLARLRIDSVSASMHDRGVTGEVARMKNASDDAGRYMKRLLSRSALVGLTTTTSIARSLHYGLTLPFDDGGWRLLPIALYEDYRDGMDGLIAQYAREREALIARYDEHVEDARRRLGDMFDIADYPSVERLRENIVMGWSAKPVPDGSHFVADMADDELERVRSDIERDVERGLESAMRDVYERLRLVVEHCAERLDDQGGTVKKVFRDSVLENVRGLVDVMPKLNVMEDEGLAALCAELKSAIDGVAADNLRPLSKDFDAGKRRRVDDAMRSAAERMGGYMPAEGGR